MTLEMPSPFAAAWLVATLTLVGCTAAPPESPWEVVESAHDVSWVLAIGSPKAQWAAGEAIDIRAVLTYVGHGQGTDYLGSGGGPLTFSLREIGGTRHLEGLSESDCSRHAMRSDQPLVVSQFRTGGYSADDPNAAFYEHLLADRLLRLPPGEWELTARAVLSMPPGCGEGRTVSLTASIVVTVE